MGASRNKWNLIGNLKFVNELAIQCIILGVQVKEIPLKIAGKYKG